MIIQGNAEGLPLGDGTIDCVVTSPPYWGLRSYLTGELKGLELGQERTPELYVSRLVGMFAEVRRVLKPSGTAWVVIGDCWAADGKLPEWGGKHAGYCGDNLRQGRSKRVTGLKQKDLVGIPFMLGFALRAAGWWFRNVEIWCKTNGMPRSVRDRASGMHEYVLMLTKGQRYYYDYEAVKVPGSMNGHGKAQAREELKSWPAGKQRGHRNRWSWRCLATAQYRGPHYAVFPAALIEPYVVASCPVGGVVLDPFAGTGVTVAVAERLARKGIGVELSWEYCGLAMERLRGKQLGCV